MPRNDIRQNGVQPGPDKLVVFGTRNLVNENGEGILPKLIEKRAPLRMNHARVAIARKVKAAAVSNQRLFDLEEQDHPSDGRLGSRHEQAVISPGIQANDG
jgi:hypothetical protein